MCSGVARYAVISEGIAISAADSTLRHFKRLARYTAKWCGGDIG